MNLFRNFMQYFEYEL